MIQKYLSKILSISHKILASTIQSSPYPGAYKDLNELIDSILFIIEKTENNGNTKN